MASVYFDTSAFIKFYSPEIGSNEVEKEILSSEKIIVSEILKVEVASALSRKVRDGELSKEQQGSIWSALLSDLSTPQIWVFPASSDQVFVATEIMNIFGAVHNLRTLDSLQLAAAQMAGTDVFICSDKRLGQVAESLFSKVKIM